MRNHLVHTLNLRSKIEVFGNLLDALANHGCLDDILSTHGATSCDCCPSGSGHFEWTVSQVSRDLRSRSEYLSDFEGPLQLDDL